MGIISALLTGGTVVGKVCQALSSVFAKTVKLSNGNSLVDSKLIVGGGRFIRSDDNTEHVMKTYIFNPTSSYMSLSMPDVGGTGAVEYVIKPTEKLPIDDCLGENVAPDSEMIVGPVSSPTNVSDAGVTDAAVKLAIKGLKIGGDGVQVGGFSISATPTGLIITAGAITIVSLVYFYFKGHRGVTAENMNNLPVNNAQDGVGGSNKTYSVRIDFDELGFAEDETFDVAKIFLATGNDNLFDESRVSRSVPLTEAEMEYFKSHDLFVK